MRGELGRLDLVSIPRAKTETRVMSDVRDYFSRISGVEYHIMSQVATLVNNVKRGNLSPRSLFIDLPSVTMC